MTTGVVAQIVVVELFQDCCEGVAQVYCGGVAWAIDDAGLCVLIHLLLFALFCGIHKVPLWYFSAYKK